MLYKRACISLGDKDENTQNTKNTYCMHYFSRFYFVVYCNAYTFLQKHAKSIQIQYTNRRR